MPGSEKAALVQNPGRLDQAMIVDHVNAVHCIESRKVESVAVMQCGITGTSARCGHYVAVAKLQGTDDGNGNTF